MDDPSRDEPGAEQDNTQARLALEQPHLTTTHHILGSGISRAIASPASGSELRVDDSEPFKDRNVAVPLVGRDELINCSHAMDPENHSQLRRIQGAKPAAQSMLAHEVAG
jgi:hypothetical protein